jgi:antitoxin component YwqK of YwqJK toxin-antitoxin module
LCDSILDCCFFSAQDSGVNKLDANGKKTGVWKKYYENGKLWYEGSFKDGKPIGFMKRYYPGGIVQC